MKIACHILPPVCIPVHYQIAKNTSDQVVNPVTDYLKNRFTDLLPIT